MSRHRNVRNYAYEEDMYEDVYGHSVEEHDLCVSPTTAQQFIFHRGESQHPNLSSFLEESLGYDEEDAGEYEEDQEYLGASKDYKTPKLDRESEAKLRSCMDEFRSILGDHCDEEEATAAILKHNFDLERAIDDVLSKGGTQDLKSDSTPRKGKDAFKVDMGSKNHSLVQTPLSCEVPKSGHSAPMSRLTSSRIEGGLAQEELLTDGKVFSKKGTTKAKFGLSLSGHVLDYDSSTTARFQGMSGISESVFNNQNRHTLRGDKLVDKYQSLAIEEPAKPVSLKELSRLSKESGISLLSQLSAEEQYGHKNELCEVQAGLCASQFRELGTDIRQFKDQCEQTRVQSMQLGDPTRAIEDAAKQFRDQGRQLREHVGKPGQVWGQCGKLEDQRRNLGDHGRQLGGQDGLSGDQGGQHEDQSKELGCSKSLSLSGTQTVIESTALSSHFTETHQNDRITPLGQLLTKGYERQGEDVRDQTGVSLGGLSSTKQSRSLRELSSGLENNVATKRGGITPTGVTHTGTTPTSTSLSGTSLTGTSLTGPSLTGTSLTGTSLTGTSLTGTSLTGTSLTDTSLTGKPRRIIPLGEVSLASFSSQLTKKDSEDVGRCSNGDPKPSTNNDLSGSLMSLMSSSLSSIAGGETRDTRDTRDLYRVPRLGISNPKAELTRISKKDQTILSLAQLATTPQNALTPGLLRLGCGGLQSSSDLSRLTVDGLRSYDLQSGFTLPKSDVSQSCFDVRRSEANVSPLVPNLPPLQSNVRQRTGDIDLSVSLKRNQPKGKAKPKKMPCPENDNSLGILGKSVEKLTLYDTAELPTDTLQHSPSDIEDGLRVVPCESDEGFASGGSVLDLIASPTMFACTLLVKYRVPGDRRVPIIKGGFCRDMKELSGIVPFKFDTDSPDDIVKRKQKKAFGGRYDS